MTSKRVGTRGFQMPQLRVPQLRMGCRAWSGSPAILVAVAGMLATVVAMPGSPARAAEPGSDIRELRLKDWQPRAMLVTRVTEVNKPAFPAIDVHNHLGGADRLTPQRVAEFLRAMDDAGVETVVNLDGGWDDGLKTTLAMLDEKHPGRFLTFALLDFRSLDDPGWTDREVARLRKGFEAGAKGLKIHKDLGLTFRYRDGRLMPVDDPKLDPIWALCGEFQRPVMIHTSDPAAFFTPLDRFNERWHELNEHPDWLFHGKDFPTRQALHEQRNRVIERHPRTTFIGAHFGNNPEDVETVGRWLDRYPNFYIDIDARISELGRQPYSARRFIIKYQDRVMFGTDTPPSSDAFRLYYRFLETDDEYWDPAKGHHQQGFWMIYGIFLPQEVLEKVYRGNARRVLYGLSPMP